MSKKDFYIGWQDEMPESTAKFLKKLVTIVGVLVVGLVIVIVTFQRSFNDHVFEFGSQTEVTGVYIAEPYPMLQITHANLAIDAESVLLVGFGKFGASEIMNEIEAENGILDLQEITLKGTLIYGDGVALLELTDQGDSFVRKSGNFRQPLVHDKSNSRISLTGEILDPKCYFGVMKPGEGKIHKSCAIRCLSGGMPPVLRVWDSSSNTYNYYLLSGKNGVEINSELLPFVGEMITFEGVVYTQLNWNVLEIDPKKITRTLANNE
ncbi:MAG: hypothetical protein JJ895_01235 [Balneolaceae bacterium]|nr:hypothetical protein [Balneolaceae bacterium]